MRLSLGLEVDLAGKLDRTSRASGTDRTEYRRIRCQGWNPICVRYVEGEVAGISYIGVVEGVEGFGAELEFSFVEDGEVLEQ